MLDRSSHRTATLPADQAPILTVIVDTEEEFDWTQPFARENTATRSIACQSRAHEQIFEARGMVPTYVIDWPVAVSQEASTLHGLMKDGACEIGTHLHPWVSPPYIEAVNHFNSYAGNLPKDLELSKLAALTTAITERFQAPPKVFKAGRYGLGPHTSAALAHLGYRIDASVVPRTAFTADGGPDFSLFDVNPYWFGPPAERLLEIPVTAGFCGQLRSWGPQLYPALQTGFARSIRLPGIASRLGLLDRVRLSPEGYELHDLMRLTRALFAGGCRVFSLTYHSPTLEPGNTPYVKDQQELRVFMQRIAAYLDFFKTEMKGVFMSTTDIHQLLSARVG